MATDCYFGTENTMICGSTVIDFSRMKTIEIAGFELFRCCMLVHIFQIVTCSGPKAAAELLSTLCTGTCACMCSPQINGSPLISFNPLKFVVEFNLCFRLLLYHKRAWQFEQLLSLAFQKSVLRMEEMILCTDCGGSLEKKPSLKWFG